METSNYWTYFLYTVIVLFAFLAVYYLYYANKNLMRRKGYTEEYIQIIRKDIRVTVFGIGLVVPALLVLAGFIVSWIYGGLDLSSPDQLFLFSICFIILVSPFPVLSYYQSKKKYRKLAMDTGELISIDFNFSVLHRMFNPYFELPVTLLYGIVLVLIVRDFHPAFIHLVLLWLFYGMARRARYHVKPSLKDTYIYIFIFLTINQLLLIYHLVREIIHEYDVLSNGLLITGIALAFLLMIKQVYYFTGLPYISSRLSHD